METPGGAAYAATKGSAFDIFEFGGVAG